MGGAILHIAFDSPPTPVSETSKRYRLLNRFGLLGAFVGLAVLWGLLSITLSPARLKASSMLARPFGR